MKYIKLHILILIAFLTSFKVIAQLGPPAVTCSSVNASGDVTISWIAPPDPTNIFTSYQIFGGPLFYGAYTFSATINSYGQNSFTHVGAGANAGIRYYYLKTISNGVSTSIASDTINTIFLNVGSAANGRPPLIWNEPLTLMQPSVSPTYTLSRENPPNVWTPIYIGDKLNTIDTITLCSVFYNYKVTTIGISGCTIQSNTDGKLFHDLTPPNVPLLDSVSVNPDGSVNIGWEASTSSDAVRYVIYTKNQFGINTSIGDTVNGHFNTSYTYTNSGAGSGAETYLIAAIDSCGNISTLTINGQKTIYLDVKYDLCSRTSNVFWSSYGNLPNGVLKYNVYCSINGGTPGLIGSSNGNSFLHPNLNPGDTYCYYVKVINTNNVITANSNTKCIVAKAPKSPAYVYITSVCVNAEQDVAIRYVVDQTTTFKGATLYRSKDGITFSEIAYQTPVPYLVYQTFIDKDVTTSDKNYYYKIIVLDSCGNVGKTSNTSKTILLHVTNDNATIFYNTLTWDDYSSWAGVIASYNVYRAVNGVFDATPIASVPYGTRVYVDDVQNFVSDNGKFSYYVEAVEGAPSIYVFRDKATSNIANAYVEVSVFVPNSFRPTGLNKVWLPIAQYVEKTDYKVTVFDRWGKKVFETTDDTEGWDGKDVTNDVFVYLIEYKNARGEFIQLKGYINLIR